MRIFITGATGFIGSHVVQLALQEGHEVVALRRNGSTPRIKLDSQPEWIEGDLECNCRDAIKSCDALLHLAAYGVVDGMNDWANCFRWNVHGSVKFLLQAIDMGVEHFVVCGSCFEYGRSGERYEFIPVSAPLEPTGAYHSSKAAATMASLGLAVDHQLFLNVLRPFHVYGEGEDPKKFWASLKKAALA
ncbi:MAG: NAD(P)-dependent oxidoreductase, partial [Verrucomicrobiota bacterium]